MLFLFSKTMSKLIKLILTESNVLIGGYLCISMLLDLSLTGYDKLKFVIDSM